MDDIKVPTDGGQKNDRGFKSLSYKVTKLGVKIKELFYDKANA